MRKIFKRDIDFLSPLLASLESVKGDILSLCPDNTGASWQGVKSATLSLFPNETVLIPHYYSNYKVKPKELNAFLDAVVAKGFKQVFFGGFLEYFLDISAYLKAKSTIKTKVIFHGFFAEMTDDLNQNQRFRNMVKATQEGRIDGLGFAKKGLSLTVAKLYNIPTFEIIYRNPAPKNNVQKSDGLNIGALVNDSFRKNKVNAVAAALLIDEAKVHVGKAENVNFLDLANNRIVEHGFLQHQDFIKLLGEMTVNIHTTFSEASGGQVCSESISQGVPCLSGNTSSFFDYDEELKERLIVQGVDDSWNIFLKLEEVLKDREYLSKRCLEYSAVLNDLAEERMNTFINF